jgi:hypothetical protein
MALEVSQEVLALGGSIITALLTAVAWLGRACVKCHEAKDKFMDHQNKVVDELIRRFGP